jgi:hypothetical protein
MDEILVFLKNAEAWIYALLGMVGLIYARKFYQSFAEYRRALFGLERDNAQRRLSEAVSMLILVAVIGIGEFLMVTFLVPTYPGIQAIPTSTLNVLATPLASLPASASETHPELTMAPPALAVNCPPGILEFMDPIAGQELNGKVTLTGTVNVGDFGFYKYQFALAGSESWVTIAAGNIQVIEGELGPWDTSTLTPGDYQLRLVVTDHQGAEQTPCTIPIRIITP